MLVVEPSEAVVSGEVDVSSFSSAPVVVVVVVLVDVVVVVELTRAAAAVLGVDRTVVAPAGT